MSNIFSPKSIKQTPHFSKAKSLVKSHTTEAKLRRTASIVELTAIRKFGKMFKKRRDKQNGKLISQLIRQEILKKNPNFRGESIGDTEESLRHYPKKRRVKIIHKRKSQGKKVIANCFKNSSLRRNHQYQRRPQIYKNSESCYWGKQSLKSSMVMEGNNSNQKLNQRSKSKDVQITSDLRTVSNRSSLHVSNFIENPIQNYEQYKVPRNFDSKTKNYNRARKSKNQR